jgi:acetoin utilization protein AcuB
MFVRDQMTTRPVTITPDVSILEAQRVMKERNIRHLPVVSGSGRSSGVLAGLLTRTTLEEVLPSKMTTLSVFELHYQLEKIKVKEAMVRKVITTTEDVPVEQAARVMWENKIGCLPVMRGNRLAGIITDYDVTRTMLDLLGAREPGIRLTLTCPDQPGEIAKITSAIAAEKGDITALGVLPSSEALRWQMVVKVRYVDQDCLVQAVNALPDVALVDVRLDA